MREVLRRILFQRELWVGLGLLVACILSRLLPHPPNLSPFGALAILAGTCRFRGTLLGILVLALLVSDWILGFHWTMPFVYAPLLLLLLVSRRFKPRAQNLVGLSLFGSALFFVISNFGVWLMEGIYPKTLGGLLECYFMAIPFFHWTLIGDLLYLGIFGLAFAKLGLRILNARDSGL